MAAVVGNLDKAAASGRSGGPREHSQDLLPAWRRVVAGLLGHGRTAQRISSPLKMGECAFVALLNGLPIVDDVVRRLLKPPIDMNWLYSGVLG